MKLQTQIPLRKQQSNLIDYNSKILLLGSCFSENIGEKLSYYKFRTTQNPFGILFHPKAIENLIENTINQKEYQESDLVFQNERFHCFDAHSNLSNADKNEVLNQLNSAISSTKKSLKEATHIIITLGTSWVYKFIETDKVVANCHKIPQKKFTKQILSVCEIKESLEAIISLIDSVNKDATVLFTVSPVRHIKDGFVENMQSKAHLLAGIHQLKNRKYFPSFEILMDELRDYRFYTEDMIHPNKTAINYIWEKFVFCWFSNNSLETMKEVETIQKGISHKPFEKNSMQHQTFLKNLSAKKDKLIQQFPFIKF